MDRINVAVFYVWPGPPFPGGGVRRFIEVASRIWRYGVKYVVVEVPPYLGSLLEELSPGPLGGAGLLGEHHEMVGFRLPGFLDKFERWRYGGGVAPWIKFIYIAIKSLPKLKKGVDLILAPGEPFEWVMCSYLASKLARIPFSCIVQLDPFYGYDPAERYDLRTFYCLYRRLGKRPIGAFLRSLLQDSYVKALNSTHLIAVSGSLAQDIRDRGITSKCYIVGNGVDLKKISAVQFDGTKKYDAIFVGVHTPRKGIEDLLMAWKKVTTQKRDARLITVGPKPDSHYRERIYSLIKELNLQANIEFKGVINDVEKINLIKSSRMLLFPSRKEAFPLVIAEALACEIPVICYDIPPVREFYDCPAVIKVPIGDTNMLAKRALEILENDTYLSLGIEGKKFVKKYDWDKVAEKEAEVYRLLLKSI